jgi:hypothetical protein
VESTEAPRDYTAAKQTVAQLQRASKLDEASLVGLAEQAKFEETVVSLAVLCKVPLEIVHRLMCSDRADPVLIICKGAGFGWPTACALLKLRAPGGIAGRSLEMANRNFDRLSVATAQRVVKFWHSRHVAGPRA